MSIKSSHDFQESVSFGAACYYIFEDKLIWVIVFLVFQGQLTMLDDLVASKLTINILSYLFRNV